MSINNFYAGCDDTHACSADGACCGTFTKYPDASWVENINKTPL